MNPDHCPIAVREELCSCALMLPLCHSNIRWPVSCRLGASDASLTHGGRAAALVPPAIAQTLYRFAEHKGEAVRLDWVHGALEPPSTMQEAPEELQELVSNIPWNQTESCSFCPKASHKCAGNTHDFQGTEGPGSQVNSTS